MIVTDYIRVETSREVYAVIRARHPEIISMGGFSDPDGILPMGTVGEGRMLTTWGFPDADWPLMETAQTWHTERGDSERLNERNQYWLIIPKREADQ